MKLVTCPDCRAQFPEIDGPTHAYVGGSPGCWAAFGELGAREMDLGIAGPSRLSVHVYTVQHPGTEGRRQAQSVGVHLMVLGAVLQRGWVVAEAVGAMHGWLRRDAPIPWLVPPNPNGQLTIRSLLPDLDRAAHEALVRAWAMDVWEAWAAHRPTIERWLAAGGPS